MVEKEVELNSSIKRREQVEQELKTKCSFNNQRDNQKFEAEKKLKLCEYSLKKVTQDLEQKSIKFDTLKLDYDRLTEVSQTLKQNRDEKSE